MMCVSRIFVLASSYPAETVGGDVVLHLGMIVSPMHEVLLAHQ